MDNDVAQPSRAITLDGEHIEFCRAHLSDVEEVDGHTLAEERSVREWDKLVGLERHLVNGGVELDVGLVGTLVEWLVLVTSTVLV